MKKIITKIILFLFLAQISLSAQEAKTASLKGDISLPSSLDAEKFIQTLQSMAKSKNIASNYTLGGLYLIGSKELKIEQNYQKAFEYFKKDADKLSMASYKIGEMYHYKMLVNASECECNEIAMKWFKKAMNDKDNMDHKQVYPIASAAIGILYLNGFGKPVEALPFLKIAANNKSLPNIEFAIGLLLNDEQFPKIFNKKEANLWLNRAWKNPDTTKSLKKAIMKYAEVKS